ncbi:zinc finger protein 595-like [Leptopilina heterotoma]|uniref:zinc finger protein 595-like n=1 Tax=Leptopilina heterotoma TaxID=63436 RepID=UPI001CA9803D|nr:zinc finger protein 595-like [Leptopilina heterotoma]
MYEIDIENEYLFLLENVGQICRVCLDLNQNNQCIFPASDNDPENTNALGLVKKLIVQGGIEVQENDGLPSNICLTCTLKLNAAHEFREQCQLSDKKLRKAFEKFQTYNTCSTLQKNLRSQQEDNLLPKTEELQIEKSNSVNDDYSEGNSKAVSEIEIEKFDYSCDNEININEASVANEKEEISQIEKENAPYKKEGCKTRKMSVFKRVTSMENLKNFKERQRQYIKKNVKSDQNEIESPVKKRVRGTNQRLTNEESEINFECTVCNSTFPSKRSLDKHSLTHDEKKYNCDKCDKEFSTHDKLLEHSKLHQPKEKSKPVRCKICEKSFKKTDTMVRHLNIHKRANPKEVFSILKEIRDKRKMENSVENNEQVNLSISSEFINQAIEEETQRDNFCTKELRKRVPNSLSKQETRSDIFHSDSNSESDQSVSDVSSFRCKHCTKCYTTEKSLQRHMLIHDEKKFVCNVCNMKFFRPDRLKSHRDRYGHNEGNVSEPEKPADDKTAIKLINSWIREELDSDNEGKGFPCDLCGKSYVTKKSLAKHRSNVHESQQNFCRNCGPECVCEEKAKIYIKPEKTKIYTCDECGKSFEKENKLQKHLRIHERAKEQQDSNFKRFLCHICSKTFRQNTGLMFHMRTHTGYKPHVCKYCGRGFTSNSNCINHERTHTGDRPFVCHFCSAAFAKSCTLKAHITTHTGEANYHCKTCGKSFRRLKYLKEHKFTHTGEKPYACKICGTAYSHSGSLFVHEKKCKAQFNNFQPATSQGAQNFCQQANIVTTPTVPPLITTLPSTTHHHHQHNHHHHVGNINTSLGLQGNKNYIESVQRMNAAAAVAGNTGLHVHANNDVSDMASAVRNFAIIGQMFH